MKPNGKGYNKNNGNISIETIWESLVLRPYGRGQYRFDMGKVTTEKIWERLAKRQTEKCKHGENLGSKGLQRYNMLKQRLIGNDVYSGNARI